jgi:CheY-like chemotaxis protein
MKVNQPPTTPNRGIPSVRGMGQLLAGVSVLIVDDEEDARDVIAELLADAGARVRMASSVDEALGSLDSADLSRPDVIVSDIGMPQKDGYAFINELRTDVRHSALKMPVVAFTAYDRGSERRRALRSGFTSYVSKTDPGELAGVVASAIDGVLKPS